MESTLKSYSALPLIVIVGPTASGKTSLAIKLAKEFDGEIISADSRAVYIGMDIGTAKPSDEEREGVPHWGFDLVMPSERFTAADFKRYAVKKIDEIRARGHTPFLVGGTGLYIDAVVYDFVFPRVIKSEKFQKRLQDMTTGQLYLYCINNNINLPLNTKNKRHLVNAILRNGTDKQRRDEPVPNTKIVGITTKKEILQQRIRERSATFFSPRMLEEARRLGNSYGWSNEAMTGNIYPFLGKVFAGELSLEEAKERFVTADWQLAKRQLTWLKRDPYISWLEIDDAYTYIAQLLVVANK